MWARFKRFDGGASSLGAEAIAAVGDGVRELLALFWRAMARFAAAALEALDTGTCIPSEGRESDFRLVLYGMMGRRVGSATDLQYVTR
jgi:hypothetical protein